MSREVILRGATALLGDDFSYDGKPRDIQLANGRIKAIAAAGSLVNGQVIDLAGRMLAPGLINGHFHSNEHFQKGCIENLPLELWVHHIRTPIPIVLTPRQVYLRTLIGSIEALRTGTTTVLDDLALGGAINRENLNAVFQAYADVGIRALVGFGMMTRSFVDNFPFADQEFPPVLLNELRRQHQPPAAQDLLDLCREIAKTHHPRSNRVGLAISASAPQRCSDQFLLACREMADAFDLPMVTHVHESRMQVVTGGLFYGKPMVEHLRDIGFLSPRVTLIHAVWLNPREIDALAKSGATVQHNAWCNLMLGSGLQPVRPLLDAGINLSLGSDGTCSSMTANMLAVLGSAAALSKLRGDDYTQWLSAKEVFTAATRGAARAFGFGSELGVIEVGAIADLVGYRLDALAFTPLNNPLRQLVYAERGAGVDFSMVDGNITMQKGRLTKIDEPTIIEEIGREHARVKPQFESTKSAIMPILNAMEQIYRRSLATPIPSDTYAARLA